MTKKEKEDVGMIPVWFFLLFLFVVIGYPMWDWLIQEEIQEHKALDRFCIDRGYNKHTDKKYTYELGSKEVQVECDKEEILYAQYKKPCLKENKWGDCTEKGYEVY